MLTIFLMLAPIACLMRGLGFCQVVVNQERDLGSSLPDTFWRWPGERPHASPGQPQGSRQHATTTPALTMIRSRLRGRAVVIVVERTLVVARAGYASACLARTGVRER